MPHIIVKPRDGREYVKSWDYAYRVDAMIEFERLKTDDTIEAAAYHSGIANDIQTFRKTK